jgi:hypothetical protein
MDYAARVREALKARCVNLKTKEAYLGMPGPGSHESDVDTTAWWCERTCRVLGPDGSAAHPSTCGAPGRTCYEAPLRP